MPRTMTLKEAQAAYSLAIDASQVKQGPIFVEHEGRPVAVIISIEEYEQRFPAQYDAWRQERLKQHASDEPHHLADTSHLEQITLPAEITDHPGIRLMLSYMAECEARYAMSSDAFYQRYMSGELARDGYLDYWATCYQTLRSPDLATDAAWLDALDAIAETANTIDFGDNLPAIQEAIEAPELSALHTGLLLTDKA